MDPQQFDRLTRALALGLSRRGTLRTVLGAGALGLLGLSHPEDADAASSNKCKPKCDECEKCDKGTCRKTKSGKKSCKAGKCKPKDNGTRCSEGACQKGKCKCLDSTESCTSDKKCCTNRCGHPAGSTAPNRCCDPGGTACSAATQTSCCTGICDTSTNLCFCKGAGAACDANSQCCSNICTGGVCA